MPRLSTLATRDGALPRGRPDISAHRGSSYLHVRRHCSVPRSISPALMRIPLEETRSRTSKNWHNPDRPPSLLLKCCPVLPLAVAMMPTTDTSAQYGSDTRCDAS